MFESKLSDKRLVSVLIPAYKPAFFEECIDSAIHQTYPNIEIIISDDCPTTEIHDIVRAKKDPRIRYYRNSPANGPALNYVESFKLAKGEFIKFLNDDDILMPSCIEKMLPLFSNDDVKVVTTYRKEIDSSGTHLPDKPYNHSLIKDNVIINGRALAGTMLSYKSNFVGEPSCIMFRAEDVRDIRPHLLCFCGYGYERSGLGDVGLILNLLMKGDCAYLGEESLVSVRIFPDQWRAAPNVAKWAANSWAVFKLLAQRHGIIGKYKIPLLLPYKELQSSQYKNMFFFKPSLLRALIRKYLAKL